MPHRLRQCGSLAFVCVALWAIARAEVAGAQQTAPAGAGEPAPVKTAADKPLHGEVLPQVYELRDKDGNLQAVPGFSFESFMELFRLKNQLAAQNRQPGAIVQDLSITGTAAAGRVELSATYTILLNVSDWERVPLRLPSAVLREQPVYEGPGNRFASFDPDRDGYFVWLRAEPGTTHKITLKLLAPLAQIGPETHLRLSVPRALVSQLVLQVPTERAIAKVSEGATLEATRTLAGAKSELKVAGIGGEFDLSWHAAESSVASLPTILEATGAQTVRASGRSINTDARLTVRSFGGEFDRFQVRLPPGADFVGTMQAGTSLVSVDPADAKGKLYEVRLEKKTAGPVEIRLLVERMQGAQEGDEMLELAGFDVVGAVRQWGTVAVIVEANLQTLWGASNHVRHADEFGSPLRRDGLSAGFEYFAQPYSLTARFVPQKTRVRVEPEYALLVGGDEARLRGKLKYTIRGAKLRTLELDAPNWEFDQIGPESVVDVDAAVTGSSSPSVIPLLQPIAGEIEISFEAHRKISPQAAISLELPRPRGDAVAPANVAVVPADNLELFWQADTSIGLTPQTARPQMKLPESQQDPMFFRADGAGAKFVASAQLHEQAISTTVATQLEIDDRETRVDQRVTFQIAYEATDHLTLGVPRAIRADRLNITLDGQRLLPAALGQRPGGDAAETIPVRVTLPAPRIGRCDLQINYVLRHDKPTSATGAALSIPLVIPGEGHLSGNELAVAPKGGVVVEYPKGPWSEDARAPRPAGATTVALSARRALSDVTLSVSSKQRPIENTTTVHRGWIQTRLTDAQRMDRAVFRFTTSEPRLALTLPQGADLGSVAVEIDARKATWDSSRPRELIVSLPAAVQGEHILELRYHFADREPLGRAAFEPPQFKAVPWIRQMYWQLVVPRTEHVLSAPAHYTSEFSWVRSDWFWQRQPTLDERELESWTGIATAEVARPGETDEASAARHLAAERATNRYLFSAAGAIQPLELYTLSRARLILLGSLPLLACGLVLIYFPWARHPGVLFAAAVLLIAFSLTDPDLALVLAQAASLGVVLAIVAALLARVSARPVLVPVPVRGSSRALERSVTEMYQRPPAGGSQPSTATNPLLPGSAPELET